MIALWLVPAEPWRAKFTSVISELAERWDAPIFEPHLTLYVAATAEVALFDRIPMTEPIELKATGIKCSEKFTKALFLQFAPRAELQELRAAVARVLGEEDAAEFDPHLSLIYKSMSAETKEDLARNLKLPFERVVFDGMRAVSTPAKIESAAAVEEWRTLWERGD